jgi:energy-coupling factor transport system permease protein
MESRAFGAHPRRTERTPPRWRVRDTAFVIAVWAGTAAVLAWG